MLDQIAVLSYFIGEDFVGVLVYTEPRERTRYFIFKLIRCCPVVLPAARLSEMPALTFSPSITHEQVMGVLLQLEQVEEKKKDNMMI